MMGKEKWGIKDNIRKLNPHNFFKKSIYLLHCQALNYPYNSFPDTTISQVEKLLQASNNVNTPKMTKRRENKIFTYGAIFILHLLLICSQPQMYYIYLTKHNSENHTGNIFLSKI